MADRMPAVIWIGGALPRHLVEELPASGLATRTWGGPPIREVTEDALRTAIDDQGYLVFYDDEAPWGEFEELEAWLREYRIPFRRHSSGRYEYLPEQVEYRPDIGEDVHTICDEDGTALVYWSDIQPIVDAMQQLASRKLSPDDECAAWRELFRMLRDKLPPELPPLPPFQIAEEAAATS